MPAYYGLIIAVFAVSWSSIFIRYCGETPALVIAFYRLFWSTLIFLVYQLFQNPAELKFSKLSTRNRSLTLLAGVILAFHFITWIAAVQLTLISHATILGSIHPVFGLLLSALFLKERGGMWAILATFFTLSGIALIGGQDLSFSETKFTGDILAVISAILVTIYILIARQQRDNIPFIPYLIAVYAGASLTLLLIILILGIPLFSYSLNTHFFMILLAIIPTGIGHSLINWSARRVEIYKVNFFIMGEPIIASILAFLLFREIPYGFFYLGSLLIFTGIFLSLREKKLPQNA